LGLDGKLLAVGQSGSSNIDDVGVEVAQANIDRAVAAAEAQAGIARQPAAAIFLGMAGVTSEDDREHIRQIARNLGLAPDSCIGVDHDCRAALAGGLSGRPGIVQIIGTGSSCYGRTADGRGWMAGGRGHLVSDEGSGCWMGLQAIRAAVRAHDGRAPHTPLLEGVLAALEIREIDDVLNRLYVVGISRAELAAMAPMVVREAMAGDAAAQGIVAKGAEDVAELVEAVARKLDMEDTPEVCIVGGLLNTGPIILERYGAAILRRLPTAQVKTAEQAPVMGAAILALDLAGTHA
jgi:N-acetylglucosamine kinase-like BadF-type ATPase